MSRCSRCGIVFIGYDEDYCLLCREWLEKVERVDEQRVREWSDVCAEAQHGKQPRARRRWEVR